MSYSQRETDECIVLEPTSGAPSGSVIWLHGLGADGYDFVPLVPELRLSADQSPRFIFPHAPVRAVTLNNGMRMRAWYDILELALNAREDESGIRESAALVTAFVDRERAAGVPARRIVLAGFSQGGAIALHAGLRHPEALAGILALSTYLPLRDRLGEAAQANRHLPILMCHGRFDPVLPLQLAELSRDLLRSAGYAVEFREYPMQHQVCEPQIRDVAAWLATVLRE